MINKMRQNWRSGLTVALVSIPLSISLAVASRVNPVQGIITAIWAGLVASLFGGSNYNIIGPTGALSGIIASFGGIGSPTLQSALTKHIPSDRTGQVLGATGLLHALARVVAPTIFNLIYSQTVGIFPQTVFLCLASVFVLAAIMSWLLKPNSMYPIAI